jgi:hypothetical protein
MDSEGLLMMPNIPLNNDIAYKGKRVSFLWELQEQASHQAIPESTCKHYKIYFYHQAL